MRKTDENLHNKIKIWEFIKNCYETTLQTPTYEEIATFMGFVHRQQVSYYVLKLKKEGKIATTPRVKRGIKIL